MKVMRVKTSLIAYDADDELSSGRFDPRGRTQRGEVVVLLCSRHPCEDTERKWMEHIFVTESGVLLKIYLMNDSRRVKPFEDVSC
jgi:hypothetical protein